MDGTFRLVMRPFVQLYTIHGFVSHGNVKKQLPMAFIIMSSRRKVSSINAIYIITEKKNKENQT